MVNALSTRTRATFSTKFSAQTASSDSFVRANQSGWGTSTGSSETWASSGSYTFSIVGNQGKILSNNVAAVQFEILGSNALQDVVVESRVEENSTNHDVAIVARKQSGTTYYMAEMNGGSFEVLKVVGGVVTTLYTVTKTFNANTRYRMKLECYGVNPTILNAKWWADGTTEPASWDITLTDSESTLQTSGTCGVRYKGGSTDFSLWDDFRVYPSLGGLSSPTKAKYSTANSLRSTVRARFVGAFHTLSRGWVTFKTSVVTPLTLRSRSQFNTQMTGVTATPRTSVIPRVFGGTLLIPTPYNGPSATSRAKYTTSTVLRGTARVKFLAQTALQLLSRTRFITSIPGVRVLISQAHSLYSTQLPGIGSWAASRYNEKMVLRVRGRGTYRGAMRLLGRTRTKFTTRFSTLSAKAHSRFKTSIIGMAATTASRFITSSATKALLTLSHSKFLTKNVQQVPHVCVIALENHSYNNASAKYVLGNANFPQVNSLLNSYGYATQFYAVAHPSLPNYISFASGSTKGVTTDTYDPSVTPLSGNTLVDSLANASPAIAWKHYAENLPSTGYLGADSGSYVQHHNPWVYFSTVRGNAAQYNRIVNYTQLATDLTNGSAPPFFFVQPNNNDNGHTGTDSACDTFVGNLVAQIQSSSWYTAHGGQIVLWWDESNPDTDTGGVGDANPGGGHVMFVVISEANSGASPLTTQLNHYGLLRAIETLYGLPSLGNSANTANGDASPLFSTASSTGGGGGGGGTASAGNPYGVTTARFHTTVDPNFGALVSDCLALGIGRIRIQQSWSLIEATPGTFSWTYLDDAVARCNQAGIKACFVIRDDQGGPATWFMTTLVNPSQTTRTPCPNINFTNDFIYGSDPTKMAAFSTTLATRYNGKTTPNPLKPGSNLFLDYIEVGNEEYDGKFDCNGSTGVGYLGQEGRDPKWYGPTLKSVVPAIRAASPNTQIGMWGMWWKDIIHRQAVIDYLYTNTDSSGRTLSSLVDYFNFHCYIGDPNVDENSLSVSLPHILTTLGNKIKSYGDAKHFRITEIGWSIREKTGVASDPTAATEGVWMTEALDDMRKSGIVDGFDVFTMSYDPTGATIPAGKSLTQEPGATPHFWPAAISIQNYAKQYPTWASIYVLLTEVWSKFKAAKSLRTRTNTRFKTRIHLSESTRTSFSISDGFKQLLSSVLSLFRIRQKDPTVQDTFSGIDGVATFVGIDGTLSLTAVDGKESLSARDGKDSFSGIG